jgi:acyl-CoA synthetase (AMP-forming)/AMP-acid ligase II/acyl carrier protein
MLSMFLEAKGIERAATLRDVIVSGEVLSRELQDRFYSRMRSRLHNLYGPTEAAVDVTHWECRRDDPREIVPIGQPIANTQIYILDGLNPVAVGQIGELCIGGDGLARGYLNRPKLTAERFIPDPFIRRPEARLYRTGDAARYLADGNIEFVGRLDDQVKVRGYRIEPGEIESVVKGRDEVRECVVVVKEQESGEKQLVAYVVLRTPGAFGVEELREYLRRQLPEYMVPTAIVVLESLPLTPNGKVDRKALPTPEAGLAELDQQYVAPRSEIERMVADVVSEVLQVQQVGIHADLFRLGAHSLSMMRIASRLSEAFDAQLPLQAVFDSPSVAAMAEIIEIFIRELDGSGGKGETDLEEYETFNL